MDKELKPEICVIGGGAAGTSVALAAANAGVSCVLVERDKPGGTAAAYAAPSKALVAAADRFECLRTGPAFGVSGAPLQVNFGKLHEGLVAVREPAFANASAERLSALEVTVIRGDASFADEGTVGVGETMIRPRHVVIATGARFSPPPLPGLADTDYLTLETFFDASRKIGRLVVIGAGRRGLEIAQACNRLGMDTTVVDEEPVLADDDTELAAQLIDRLYAEGVRVRDRLKIDNIARRKGGVRLTVREQTSEEPFNVDGTHILVATGSVPNIDGLNLDKGQIQYDENGITVDRRLRTSNRRVYAIGDVLAGPAAAGRAMCEADFVSGLLLGGGGGRYDPASVPVVALTDPQLAKVGLSEDEARKADQNATTLRLPFVENDLCLAERATAGMIKVMVSGRGQVVGAAAIGRGASDVISVFSLAVANRMPISALKSFVAPYPSRADIVRRVAGLYEGPVATPGLMSRMADRLRRWRG